MNLYFTANPLISFGACEGQANTEENNFEKSRNEKDLFWPCFLVEW